MKARVINLHRTEAEWLELQEKFKAEGKDFVPLAGEIIIYDQDESHDYARIKIGDGDTPLDKLAFIVDSAISVALDNLSYQELDGGRV